MTMMAMKAARAYQASADTRGLRMQEADIFYRATGALRAARDGSPVDRARGLADNRQLWLTLAGILHDPDNQLPKDLRAAMLSVAKSVERQMDQPSPDFDFLIAVNENIAAGLATGL